MKRLCLRVYGVVQGVGFRPAVFRLAVRFALGGYVCNTGHNVTLCVEGEAERVELFRRDFLSSMPVNARIDRIEENFETPVGEREFVIRESHIENGLRAVTIPVDVAICADCRREVLDVTNRRYAYPFTTCTNCGPRFTVITALPYDRERSSLAEFPLCPECMSEYRDPQDRRFHAESTACSVCGPEIHLHNYEGEDHLPEARRLLAEGKILALRGIGGFQICCDAENRQAIKELRLRKPRPHKPLAVMVRNLDVLRKYCEFSDQEAELLSSSASPIVLLRLRSGSGLPVKQLSPDAPELLGVMLPTSPLHVLLFSDGQKDYFDFLVMTSGNRSGEPICLDNSSALKKLGGCVDGFLLHNREILRICDDSVCRFHNDRFFMIRRARGYVPEKISLQKPVSAQVLAMGADLKNTLCFAFPDYVIMSQHVGDLNSLPAAELHEKLISSLPDFFNFSPAKIAVDLHPDFVSSTLGRKLAKERNLELVEVQHHHAHAAGVMAEYGLSEALAVILDGHGYGTDCNSWGAELLHVKMPGFRRLVSWQNIALIGGDKMALQPQRSAFSALSELGGEQFLSRFCKTLGISDQMADNFRRIKPQSSLTSSAGRYFDAAACIAGCAPEQITYEGQAAICLESLALKYLRSLKSPCKLEPYIMEWLKNKDDLLIFRMPLVLAQMWDDINDGKFRRAPLRFHITVAHVIREMARIGRLKTGLQSVVLSGGVFQNMLLVELSLPLLEADGFSVYLPVKTPCNDGGIAFGQAVVAGYENIIG